MNVCLKLFLLVKSSHSIQTGSKKLYFISFQITVDSDNVNRIQTLCVSSKPSTGETKTNRLYTTKSVIFLGTDFSIAYSARKPGIGTYNKHQFLTKSASMIASTIDQALALHLNDHVKDGYALLICQ